MERDLATFGLQTMDNQSALPIEKVNEDAYINFDDNIIDAKLMSRIMRQFKYIFNQLRQDDVLSRTGNDQRK